MKSAKRNFELQDILDDNYNKEQCAYEYLLEKMSQDELFVKYPNILDNVIKDNGLYFSDIKMKLTLKILEQEDNVLQMGVNIKFPNFSEDLNDIVVGFGQTTKQRLEMAVENVLYSIIKVVINSLIYESKETLYSKLIDKKHNFMVYKSDVILQEKYEKKALLNLWDLYKNDIMSYIGAKEFYLIKIYASNNNSDIICEVRINGEEIPDLSKKVSLDVRDWNEKGFHVCKQFVVLRQDMKTRLENPYSKEQIKKFIKEAIKIFESGIEYDKVLDKIYNIIEDNSMAVEFSSLIPEIYCKELFYEPEYSDNVIISKCNKNYELHKTQIRNYKYIEDVIYEHLQNDIPSKQQMYNAISVSATSKAIAQSLENGSSLKDLYISDLAYFVEDDYIVR